MVTFRVTVGKRQGVSDPGSNRPEVMKMAGQKKKSATTKGRRRTPASRNSAAVKHAQHHAWNKVELETLNPLLQRQMVTGTNVMLARILLKKGCVVPLHSHHNEQLSYVIEGALKFTMG